MAQVTAKYSDGLRITEEPWGYSIFQGSIATPILIMVQSISAWVGLLLLFGAAGLLTVSNGLFSEVDILIKLCLTLVLSSAGILFIQYATTGTDAEYQVDLHNKVLRRVLRNRHGSVREIGKYKFAEFSSVRLGRDPDFDNQEVLLLYHQALRVHMPVAGGDVAKLEALRDRLRLDLSV